MEKREWAVCFTVDTTASVIVEVLAACEDEAHELAWKVFDDSPELAFEPDDYMGEPYVSWADPNTD